MKKKTILYIFIGIASLLFVLFLVEIVKQFLPSPQQQVLEITEPQLTSKDAQIGPVTASHRIFHYGFVGCDYCEEMQLMLTELQAEHPNDILLVWKDYPNVTLAPQSLHASAYLQCANDQDRFWDVQPYLFNRPILTEELFSTITTDLELNEKKMERCLNNGTGEQMATQNYNEGEALGITAAPTLFINNTRYTGLLTKREIMNILGL